MVKGTKSQIATMVSSSTISARFSIPALRARFFGGAMSVSTAVTICRS